MLVSDQFLTYRVNTHTSEVGLPPHPWPKSLSTTHGRKRRKEKEKSRQRLKPTSGFLFIRSCLFELGIEPREEKRGSSSSG